MSPMCTIRLVCSSWMLLGVFWLSLIPGLSNIALWIHWVHEGFCSFLFMQLSPLVVLLQTVLQQQQQQQQPQQQQFLYNWLHLYDSFGINLRSGPALSSALPLHLPQVSCTAMNMIFPFFIFFPFRCCRIRVLICWGVRWVIWRGSAKNTGICCR